MENGRSLKNGKPGLVKRKKINHVSYISTVKKKSKSTYITYMVQKTLRQ